MSFSAHSAFPCDRLLNMFCSAAYKLAPPFGHIKVELCPGLEPNSWTKSAKPQCLCGIILFVLLYRNHLFYGQFRWLSYLSLQFNFVCYGNILHLFCRQIHKMYDGFFPNSGKSICYDLLFISYTRKGIFI